MKVKEVADLVGISVRTLHHYDEIGLLTPEDTTESGYRLYSQRNLSTLQQIFFFKELGFPLKKIKEIMESPGFNRNEALEVQRNMLLEKRKRMDAMITMIDKTIQDSKRELVMSEKEKFAGFDFSNNPYEQEARERWGDKAIDESNARINNMSKDEQKLLGKEFDAIYNKLAKLRNQSPESAEAQAAIEEWFVYLNKMGDYSLDVFKGLGQMYVDDERFTKNIDKYGAGLAEFMRDAMAVYADNKK
ncbi:MerR family transcriptional regulator [Virgibacillus phasianinus]|uniref:MerR family transcriptional regulator n=1 Tax=Virgibacillus phasianinus TaxID=2017483 RepID=A0A220U067_9BACI|nr:MerR family transcriptional regulator [Virgibacillus phasianinus]ASK61497.1 MerR family transcriptional regulator [Virgibacillus phasianinus]